MKRDETCMMEDWNKNQLKGLKRMAAWLDKEIEKSLKALDSCSDCSPRIETFEDRVMQLRRIREAIPHYIFESNNKDGHA